MIHLSDICVTFNQATLHEKQVLNNIDLTIHQGDFIVVIGGNGAGKSTFLNVIAGEVKPFKGTVTINQKDITRDNSIKRAKKIARVFQDPLKGTAADLTVAENLLLASKRGQSKNFKKALCKNNEAYFYTYLKKFNLGLESRLKDLVSDLSGGQRQALSLIMAVIQPMEILLLDEHTAALDPATSQLILSLTQNMIKTQNLTALMVTHNMHHAIEMGNRIVMLDEGKIIFDYCKKNNPPLTVNDLLEQFEKARGQKIYDDTMRMI